MKNNQPNNTGVLFKNDFIHKPNAPQISGRCTVNGVPYRIAGWKYPSTNGKKARCVLQFTSEDEWQKKGDNPNSLDNQMPPIDEEF